MACDHLGPRYRPHSRGAQFMDGLAACGDELFVRQFWIEDGGFHALAHRMRRPLPVRDLIEFVLRPAEGEAQHRDAEPILHARIDLAKAVLVGDHLTAQRHPDRRARSTADRLLQPRAPDPRQGSGRRDTETAADLEMRSEEHTSELQSLMRISYAVFCLKKKN